MAIDKITTPAVTDDSVTLAKMAPGTDGNIISYDASGNPVAVATGSDGQVLTSAGAGAPPVFETPASAANTPNFFAMSSGNQGSVTDNTWTKATLGTEVFDSANAFASSRFTVPSGQGGKYQFNFKVNSAGSTAYQKTGYSNLYLNGSGLSANYETIIFMQSGVFNMDRIGVHGSVILNLSAGNYIELYAKADVESGTVNFYNAFLGGYKIIE